MHDAGSGARWAREGDDMWNHNAQPALVIDGQRGSRAALRAILEAERYAVTTVPSTAAGLDVLRTSSGRMVVLCEVAPDDTTLGAASGLELLDALARDARLARRHDYILLAQHPEQVCANLGSLPAHVTVSILRKPFDVARLLSAVEEAGDLTPLTVDAARHYAAAM